MHKLIDYINSLPLEQEWYTIFGTNLPQGKFICPNPLHKHKSNTPSCKVYGNGFKCFGQCNRYFGVYNLLQWYNPARIEEIKKTVLVPKIQRPLSRSIQVNVHGSPEQVVEQLIQIHNEQNKV